MTRYIMILIKMKSLIYSLMFFFLMAYWQSSAFAEVDSTSQSVLRYQKQMAKRGSASAQFKLGLMYETGLGVNSSKIIAARWYRQAARQHYQPAINRLTYLKVKKSGLKEEDLHWLKNLKKDALLHQGEALFLLGKMYADGTGVEKSLTRALSFLHGAKARNIPGSETEINRIEQELNLLQAQYLTSRERAKIKKFPIKIHKPPLNSNVKTLAVTPPQKNTRQKNGLDQSKKITALSSTAKKEITNIASPILSSNKDPGLVIKISKPIQLSEVYTPHPMDLICAGNNRFRRRCR